MDQNTSMNCARENFDYTVRLRRHFHKNPELSFKEFNTTETIISELNKLNIEYIRTPGTGVLATVHGKPGGTVLGLRADMDALPVTETNNVGYMSAVPGVMHACGHDGHMAMLLTVAKYLSEHRDEIVGTVKLIFQPAEEIVAGAKRIILDNPGFFKDINEILAMHLWNDLPLGLISAEAGPRMAASDSFTVKVIGKMGHGGVPHQTVDAIYIGANIINALQPVVSRETDPLEPVVVSVGTFHAGSAYNVIAGEAVLSGTVRCFNNELRGVMKYKIERIVRNVTKAYDADYVFDYYYGTPPVINSLQTSVKASEAVMRIMGPAALCDMRKVMGGEDFAYYLENCPGSMIFVGSKTPGSYPHHHDKFDLAEDALAYGAAFFIEYIRSYCSI